MADSVVLDRTVRSTCEAYYAVYASYPGIVQLSEAAQHPAIIQHSINRAPRLMRESQAEASEGAGHGQLKDAMATRALTAE